MSVSPTVAAPGTHFNFAQHLIARNAQRPNKIAYIDDDGQLSYGDLTERINRMAQSLHGKLDDKRALLAISQELRSPLT